MTALPAWAGTWSYQPWTGDADSGIVSGSTRVAYHFADTRTATVNGVSVLGVFQGLTSTNLDASGGISSFQGASNDLTALGGSGSAILGSSFNYNGLHQQMFVTAKSLTVGQTYAVSFFGVGFDATGTRTETFSSGSDSLVVDQNFYGQGKGIRVTYNFTATAATQLCTLTSAGSDWGFNAATVRTTSAPTATSNSATSVTTTAADLNAFFSGNGATTSASFQYSTSPTLASGVTTVGAIQVADYASQTPSQHITGLSPGTTYYYRGVATSSVGTTNGTILSFTTTGNPPTATTGVASSITATGATLNGTVNANGASTAVTFQYGTTTSYGQTATASQSPVSGSSATSVSAALTSLQPGTYHFRVVATNSGGTTNGTDATFVVTIANAAAAYTSASVVGVTGSNPTLTGGTATLSLGYAPVDRVALTGFAPVRAPTPPDVRFSASGGWRRRGVYPARPDRLV